MDVVLPWRALTLDNGLTVLMHPDPAIPEVAVELWIRGGSREEGPGEYGIAHLFEHYGLRAARTYSNPSNLALYSEVTRDGNAKSDYDYLRFFHQVAPHGLELALASAADRLDSSADGLTAERLERDKRIVINELRRSEDTGWDPEVMMRSRRGTFGADHPYGHGIAGSVEEVQGASLERMQVWHRRHVGAANALLLLAGGFDPARAEALVRRYFGSVAPGTPLPRVREWIPRPQATRREAMEKGVPYGTVYLRWPVPPWGSADGDHLTLLGEVLAGAADSRLGRRASASGAGLDSAFYEANLWEMAGEFTLGGTFLDRAAADSVEAILRAELEGLLEEGPTGAELGRARALIRSRMVRGLEQPAWIGGRTEVLGQGMLFRGDPDHYRVRMARIARATAAEVREAGRRWLASPGYTLHVLPRPRYTVAEGVDRRAALPRTSGEAPAFPVVRDTVLRNGLRVIAVERPQLPVVQVTLGVRAGRESDDARTAGRAQLALDALQRVPATPGGVPLVDALGALGGEVTASLDDDLARLAVSVLSEHADAALHLLAGALTRELPHDVHRRAREEARARLERTLADPLELRTRALACRLSVEDRCNPSALDGLGTRSALAELSAEAMRDFLARRYHPANAILAVSGDISLERIVPGLERAFGEWRPRDAANRVAAVPYLPGGAVITVLDRPGASQSHILFAQPLPAGAGSDLLRARLLTYALSRSMDANLRERKQWSYGVWPVWLEVGRERSLLRMNVAVQTDRTAEAVAEILADVRRLARDPVDTATLASARTRAERQVSWAVTSLSDLNDLLLDMARLGLPGDYPSEYLQRVRSLSPADVNVAARALLRPDAVAWVIVGDRARIEPGLRALGIGEVRVVGGGELW
ncbi:MAG TPA: insulinase family protein [Longimicrobiaceae bacterium]|nr:insulinase family protein [Longimicrobiaceae bacterium]